MKHVGRTLGGAAQLAPLPGEALLIGLPRGRLAFASGPILCHLVLAFQGLRWVKALTDPFHVGTHFVTFGNVHSDALFEFRERGRWPVAFRSFIRFRACL